MRACGSYCSRPETAGKGESIERSQESKNRLTPISFWGVEVYRIVTLYRCAEPVVDACREFGLLLSGLVEFCCQKPI